jgi:hypothetical protein
VAKTRWERTEYSYELQHFLFAANQSRRKVDRIYDRVLQQDTITAANERRLVHLQLRSNKLVLEDKRTFSSKDVAFVLARTLHSPRVGWCKAYRPLLENPSVRYLPSV